MRGGRGPGKSHAFTIVSVLRMCNALGSFGYPDKPVRIASCRDFNTNLDESVKVLVEHYIHKFGLSKHFRIRNRYIENRRTGSYMFFRGVSRSPGTFKGVEDVDIFWMEQAEVLMREMEEVEPTIRAPGHELWFGWNPTRRDSYCWQRFVKNAQPADVNVWANWDRNPWWERLPGLNESREYYKKYEPQLYKWMWLGYPMDGDADEVFLPHDLLLECVTAYEMGLAPNTRTIPCAYAGMDWAEGGANKCALVIREGPVVREVHQWPGVMGNLTVSAEKAWGYAQRYDPLRIYYDASTPAMTALEEAGFSGVFPTAFGGAVQGPDDEYEDDRLNRDVFENRTAQMSMGLRLRAINTLRLKNGEDVDPWHCLFIPDDLPDLDNILEEWSRPERVVTKTGKWAVDKAPETKTATGKTRRADSPDRYDAAVLAFAMDSDGIGLRAF